MLKQIKSNQIKSLLLSHHHSTSALVSEILMSVLQTVQKNNRQFTYGQTVQKNNKQFTYGQTVQKNNKQFTYGQTVQKNCTGAFTVLQTVQKKTTTIYIWTDSAKKKNNSNLHMDSTYLQTVQKTMCKIHIHILSTLSTQTGCMNVVIIPYNHFIILILFLFLGNCMQLWYLRLPYVNS